MPVLAMQKLKYFIKLVVAYSLFYTGILRLVMLVKLRRRAVVLMYHRVLSKQMRSQTCSHSGIIVDLETFDKQIQYLKKKFKVVTLEEFTEKIKSGINFDQSTCLITFDDGWKDNYVNAYPILKKYRVSATIFLPAGFVDHNRKFWQEKLSRILVNIYCMRSKQPDSRQEYFDILKKYHLQDILGVPEQELKSYVADEVSSKKKMTYTEIEQMISDLTQNARPSGNEAGRCDSIMNWDEVRQMKKDGISFGSHGISHRILTKVSESELDYEISESKRVIEGRINEDIFSISYPNGDYESDIIELVKSNGYHTAFSTEKGFVDVNDNPYSLRRINIHNDVTNNIPMFLSTIIGIF